MDVRKARAAGIGVAAGVALYLAGLGLHVAHAGWPLRPYPGCVPDPGQAIINVPALVLGAVVPLRAVSPQGVGKIDGRTVDETEAHWSPLGFVGLGLAFYGAAGGAAGVMAAMRRRRRS